VEDFLKRLRSTRSIEPAPGSGGCEPRHRDEWRRRLSACVDAEGGHFRALLMIATLKITMSKWQHCKFDNWIRLFLFSFAVNVNEQRIIAFLTEKCFYLNLRSKVRTQLR